MFSEVGWNNNRESEFLVLSRHQSCDKLNGLSHVGCSSIGSALVHEIDWASAVAWEDLEIKQE